MNKAILVDIPPLQMDLFEPQKPFGSLVPHLAVSIFCIHAMGTFANVTAVTQCWSDERHPRSLGSPPRHYES